MVRKSSAFNGYFDAMYPSYARGLAYAALGQHREAAAEFRKILAHRGLLLGDPMGALTQLQLARTLAGSGEREEARAEYAAFLAAWRDADAGLPTLERARIELAALRQR